ncbi:IstB-like ATP-binding protein [Oribacterium sp. oral taxon 078 str. F0262]|uniref:IS21-like element helper ATPase IstB n=1 Tax=Oribacterium sp. oral taxon 078 TaxID=652706 RepID=UPI0001BCBD40|nr:IS21-like element helper ATPase IstB [Oribacterium sp. oral taxon 078]EFE93231.1 IstB-like ATP-binding protein [Oribacterium sp. oral taxon 078 str. F0262]
MRTDTNLEQVKLLAKQLKVPTFGQYPDLLRQMDSKADFGSLLLSLMQAEYEQRQENQNQRRLKQAGLPYTKTLEELDLLRYDGKITDLFLNELSSCKFIKEKKNLVMLGNPGRGKTHMAIGLALKACSLGMSVLFKNAASLSTELAEAKESYVLGRLEKRIRCADLLILDEMGYVSFDRYQSELLFKVIADRSERGSIIVTTNLPFSEWVDLFENTAMVAAMVDRLTFHSYILDMNGTSYRLEQAKKQKR